MIAEGGIRMDKWLWHARFFKSRSLATQFCNAGKLRVDGMVIKKAHFLARPYMVLTFSRSRQVHIVKILALGSRRGPATEAKTLYEDLSPPISKKSAKAYSSEPLIRTTGSGRPTKRDRRRLDQLRSP